MRLAAPPTWPDRWTEPAARVALLDCWPAWQCAGAAMKDSRTLRFHRAPRTAGIYDKRSVPGDRETPGGVDSGPSPGRVGRRGCAESGHLHTRDRTSGTGPKPAVRAGESNVPDGSLRSDNAELGGILVRKLQADLLDAGTRPRDAHHNRFRRLVGRIAQPRRFTSGRTHPLTAAKFTSSFSTCRNGAICHCQRCVNGRSCLQRRQI